MTYHDFQRGVFDVKTPLGEQRFFCTNGVVPTETEVLGAAEDNLGISVGGVRDVSLGFLAASIQTIPHLSVMSTGRITDIDILE